MSVKNIVAKNQRAAVVIKEFARGLDTILVIEEKRSFLELQLREALYNEPNHPKIVGKDFFPPVGELDPDQIHVPGVYVDRLVRIPPDGIWD